MNTKNQQTTLASLLILSIFALLPNLEARKESGKPDAHADKKVKYVQGGACGRGKGTKEHPYHSLAQAQADTSWKTLIVLPSTTVLDGGITLRPGTKLIGTENPTGIALSTNQPTITNSSDATNGGNGVVVTGDAVIENIYFKNIWASAINYDQGEDVCIRKVLVTGHNQGNLAIPIAGRPRFVIEVPGILGQTTKNGKTSIEKVIIRNNNTGGGIIELPYQGAQRELLVNNSEITELASLTTQDSPVNTALAGIATAALQEGTVFKVIINNSYIHDFRTIASPFLPAVAVVIAAYTGAETRARISTCTFDHIFNNLSSFAIHIFAESFTPPAEVNPGVKSHIKLEVDNCSFREPLENNEQFITGVQAQMQNGDIEWAVKNSTLTNIFDNFFSITFSDGIEKGVIIGNKGSGFDLFYGTATGDAGETVANPQRISNILIKGNNFVGGTESGAIVVIPNIDGSDSPWNRLAIKAENNCFNGQGTGFAGLAGLDFGTSGAGNATINAHNNSIVNYEFDILDDSANVNYLAQRNFWGQGGLCATGADCASTQICENGFCVGPDNIETDSSYTGILDVSNPLRASIKCPQNCCRGIGTVSATQHREPVDAKSKAFEAKLNKLKADFKARHNPRPYGK